MPVLRALLLDFGGTLVTEAPARARIYADAAESRGLSVSEAEMAGWMGHAHEALPLVVADEGFRYTRRWFERFIESIFRDRLGLSNADVSDVQEELLARFADARTFRVFPGARELLGRARRGSIALGLVSNWSDALPGLVRDLDLRFDAVLSSALERVEKPDPAIFERALEQLDVRPEHALHVGDSVPNDIEGARAVGIDAVLVDREGRHGAFVGRRVRTLDEIAF